MKKRFSITIFIVCLVTGLISSFMMLNMDYKNNHEALHTLLQNQADQMGSSVMQSIRQVYGLQALVIGADGGDIDLGKVGPYLVHESHVRNVLIAPGGVVSDIYPREGSESVIGMDLHSEANASYREAMQARDTGELVVTGPYELVEGGLAISGRLEVYVPQTDGTFVDWGLVSVTLDFPEVLDNTEYMNEAGYLFKLDKLETDINEYVTVLDGGYCDGYDHEELEFSVQNMNFRLCAYPQAGWHNIRDIMLNLLVVMLIAITVSVCAEMLRVRRSKLNEKATRDSLTGLLNRDSGSGTIDRIIKGSTFSKAAFLLIDIDHFKSVNDVLGHQTGDRVLIESAEIFRKACRSNDIICRLGGDEFVIFLPCENPEIFIAAKANQINESMRRAVEHEGSKVDVSCSIGIAIATDDGVDFNELYKHADKALYTSKERGRNCYSFYAALKDKI